MRILVVATDGSSEVVDREPEGEYLQPLLGGWLEVIDSRDGWHAYCDEEGKLKFLGVNLAATRLLRALGWRRLDVICGPALFLANGLDGEEADVPEVVLDAARKLGMIS